MRIKPINEGHPGVWIVVEGVDGAGKTTAQKKLIEGIIREYPGREVVSVRAPDGAIRDLLLQRPEELHPRSELLLYIASHLQIVWKQVSPAIKRGAIVVQDRYIDSTRAYQGAGRGLSPYVAMLHGQFLGNARPDHTVYVTATEEICERRLNQRGLLDFMDKEAVHFKRTVRRGMEDIMREAMEHRKTRSSFLANNGSEAQLDEAISNWFKNWSIPDID